MSIIGCANCGGTHYGSNECPYLEKNMGEPCVVCGARTSYCCSDCAIDGKGKVYICELDTCRDTHQRDHAATSMRPEEPDTYDAGLLGGDKSWSVEQWHDYVRSVLASAHKFYAEQFAILISMDDACMDIMEQRVRELTSIRAAQ